MFIPHHHSCRFLPPKQTVSLTEASWSPWQKAASKAPGSKQKGKNYLTQLCQRCYLLRRPIQSRSYAKRKRNRSIVKTDFDYFNPPIEDLNDKERALVNYCRVHRTRREKKLWSLFNQLEQDVQLFGDKSAAKHHKMKTIRQIAGSNNMTTQECLLRYNKWPKRQRLCDRRKLDRVLASDARTRLSAWRKLLQGDWMTSKGLVTLVTVVKKKRKVHTYTPSPPLTSPPLTYTDSSMEA